MPDRPKFCIEYASRSDPGRDPDKQVNEDACIVAAMQGSLLAVVCDGMGGHQGGQLASHTASQTIRNAIAGESIGTPAHRESLSRAVVAASGAVYRIGGALPVDERPGATCVAVWLHAGGLELAHVGDSRCYRWRDHRLEALTRDHSVIEAWIQAGEVSREMAHLHPDAHRITRALGVLPTVDVELRPTDLLQVGDRLLLCSDGLTDLVNVEELGAILGKPAPLVALIDELIALANERGGHDNITAVLIGVMDSAPEHLPGSSQAGCFHVISNAATTPTELNSIRAASLDHTMPLDAVDRTAVMAVQPAATVLSASAQVQDFGRAKTQPLDLMGCHNLHPPKGLAHSRASSGTRRHGIRLWLLGLALMLAGLAVAISQLHC